MKENDAVETLTSDAGLAVIWVLGSVASRLKPRVATAWLPAPSVARTRKVCGPSLSGLAAVCDPMSEQGPKLGLPLSIEHSKLAPGSEPKPKVGVESLVRPEGPELTDTAGGVRSMVQS